MKYKIVLKKLNFEEQLKLGFQILLCLVGVILSTSFIYSVEFESQYALVFFRLTTLWCVSCWIWVFIAQTIASNLIVEEI
jgi:hypothetical protein